jgi:hypothetical protein
MQWSRDADFMFNNPRKKFSPQKRSHSAPGYGQGDALFTHVSPQAHPASHRHGDAARRCLHLGTSADMDGFHVLMDTRSYRGHRDLTLHQQQMDSVASQGSPSTR